LFNSLKRLWNEHPLLTIILIALIPRLVAVVFSKGFGMHDDHFEVIEQPFLIIHDINFWTSRVEPEGHSIVYPGIHYLLLNGFNLIGIQNPQSQMFLIRLLHALYSLLTVFFSYKIAEVLSNRETAKKVGLVLALFWVFPFLSVRNLVEIVCIPPIMAGFYFTLASKEKLRNALIAGLCFGLAFTFRYQTISIAGTLSLVFLLQKQFKQVLLLASGFFLSAIIIQGSADVFAWGYPFASFIKYIRHNVTHSGDYTTGPWYNYLVLVLGALIPPISFFLLYGFFRNWKKTLLILLPVLVFFVLHSMFPNKQERFIFPVIPLILILSVVGWEEFVKQSTFWSRHQTALKSLWSWFWIINTILLLLFSTHYSKKSRVEAMYSLYGKSANGVLFVGGKYSAPQMPMFYCGLYPFPTYDINNDEQLADAKAKFDAWRYRPNYAIFFGLDDLEKRLRHIESSLGLNYTLERKIEHSLLDHVLYKLNPMHNKNETTFVFKAEGP
jgi:hypothetical protein